MADPARLTMRTVVVLYVGAVVLLPVSVLCYRALEPGLGQFLDAITSAQASAAFRRTAVVAGVSVVLNTIFGVGVALLLARRRFPGKRLFDVLIDLPIAISPIVVGLALVLVYGVGGWFGFGVNEIIGATPGLVLATTFVSLPLVLRSVLPVLEEAGTEQEQAAASLGANWLQTFRRVTLPTIRVALGYGVVLALARCVGEYGAVLVVSGGFQDQATAPLLINQLLQVDFDKRSAFDMAFVLMLVSIAAIVAVSLLQGRRKDVSA